MAKNIWSRKHDLSEYRSGLEDVVGDQLRSLGIPVRYEELTLKYVKPSKLHRYTPDFLLPNGIIVETKGRFVTADRQKMLLVRSQYPDLDIRIVFSNPQTRISKKSKTTYAMWCEKYGFLFAKQMIPMEWIQEPPNPRVMKALQKLLQENES